MGYVKCVDTDNNNKSVVLVDGDIQFYEDVKGSPVRTTAITRASLYEIKNNETLVTNEFFDKNKDTPNAFVLPNSVKVFDSNKADVDQVMDIFASDVVVNNKNKAEISVKGSLDSNSTGGFDIVNIRPEFLILSNHESQDPMSHGKPPYPNFYDTYEQQWRIPISNDATNVKVTINIYSFGQIAISPDANYQGGYGGMAYFKYDIKFGFGGSSGAYSWVKTLNGVKRNSPPHSALQLEADLTRNSGDFLYIYSVCKTDESTYAPELKDEAADVDLYLNGPVVPIMVACKGNGGVISKSENNIYTVAVIAR